MWRWGGENKAHLKIWANRGKIMWIRNYMRPRHNVWCVCHSKKHTKACLVVIMVNIWILLTVTRMWHTQHWKNSNQIDPAAKLAHHSFKLIHNARLPTGQYICILPGNFLCIRIYIHTCVYVCTYILLYIYIYICIHIYICIYVCTYVDIDLCVSKYV